jgi:hypothetical protein
LAVAGIPPAAGAAAVLAAEDMAAEDTAVREHLTFFTTASHAPRLARGFFYRRLDSIELEIHATTLVLRCVPLTTL